MTSKNSNMEDGFDLSVLPEPTLPRDVIVTLLGFGENDRVIEFGEIVMAHLRGISRYVSLERLAGVFVTTDLRAALENIDHGYDNPPQLTYTDNEQLRCAAKSVTVARRGIAHIHIVYDAQFIAALTNPQDEHYDMALHILAHECGHVAEMTWRDLAFPRLVMRRGYPNVVEALLRGTADVCWEEYAVCRLTARFGNAEELKSQYSTSVAAVVSSGLESANTSVAMYRLSGDLDALLHEAGSALCEPLRIIAYLLGHLDGTEDDTAIEVICPALSSSPFLSVFSTVRDALRVIWDSRLDWQDDSVVFSDLRSSAEEAMRICGITFEPLTDGGTYVHVR